MGGKAVSYFIVIASPEELQDVVCDCNYTQYLHSPYLCTLNFWLMTPAELEQKIKNAQGVLVYFKNDFCAPCKALRPKVSDLVEAEFPQMEMVIVDTVTHPELAGQYNVFGNPTILVFFEGREYIRKSKYISMPELQGEVERLYQMVFEA